MKINVHAGHNSHVPGANGCFSETVEDRNVKNAVINKLRLQGHTVYDCTDEDATTQSKNLRNIVDKCNAHSVDLDVSIHFNAYNGTANGTEVLIYNSTSKAKSYAERIVNKIALLGFSNRGVKMRSDLYVLKHTKAPALLIECCFCDSVKDRNMYDCERMAKAIVEGITGQTATAQPSQPQQSTVPSNSGVNYKVKVDIDDLYIRKGPGTNYGKNGFCPKGVYTIIQESAGQGASKWGKLKSGAGWVSLDYAKKI